MNIKFYTPALGIEEDAFGCATFGFVGQENERMPGAVSFVTDVKGFLARGSYEDCLAQIPERPWQAGIVLLGNAGDENTFIRRLSKKVKAPLTGGGAAINPETGEKGLIAGGGEAAVLMIDDDRYACEVSCQNIHSDILGEHMLTLSGPRRLEKIDGKDAASWLRSEKAKLGLSPDDFEHLTFSDAQGINAHLSETDGRIFSGRDLGPRMLLRYAAPDCVQARIQAFYQDENAVVFGCAGLKGILSGPLNTKGVGLFMFGEVCGDGFGNLMLSKIRVRRRG